MKISESISEAEILDLQNEIYKYFESGYEFEDFLKPYLIKIGLDEVEVTQRSKDGGIDLKAIRKGVGDFSETDITHYYIQAKRNNFKNNVGVKTIRELKGTIPFGHKGILITTSNFTSECEKEASNDPSKPVILIDGKSLVMSCIDNKIGFVFKPIFSTQQMDCFFKKGRIQNQKIDDQHGYVEKLITRNDIRAKIISIPSSIMNQFSSDLEVIYVNVNEIETYKLKINRGRNYFSSVTNLFRKFNLLSDENIINPKVAKWSYDPEKNVVNIILKEEDSPVTLD